MLLRLIMPFDFHCFSYSVDFSPSLPAGRRRDADYHRALARLSGNSRHAALRQFEHSPTSNVAYRGNFEALTGAALTLVSGKLRGIDSETTQNRRLLLALR
jgi:hypothetical protein